VKSETTNAQQIREAELRAAAEAVVVWVRARRATWPDLPPEVARVFHSPEVVAYELMPGRAPTAEVPVSSGVAPPAVGPVAPERRPLAGVGSSAGAPVRLPVVFLGALGRLPLRALSGVWNASRHFPFRAFARWSLRAGVVAGIAALAIVGGKPALESLKRAVAPKTGTAVLVSVPAGSEVLVDGAAVGTTPLTTELRVGHHVVEFRRRGATQKLEIDVTAGQSTTGRIDWNAKRTGQLVVTSEPPGARVLIDGAARGVTPVTLDNLSVGPHVVLLRSDQGSVQRTVEVTAGRTAQIAESIYAGWLKVFAPFDIEIADGTRAIRLDERGQAMLTPGPHQMRFANRALGYVETQHVEIKPGEVASLSLSPPPSKLTVTATAPAEVLVDGESAGQTPLTDHPVPLGTHDIVVKSSTGDVRRFGTLVTVKPVRIDVDFSKP
jgi:hypothetical protein